MLILKQIKYPQDVRKCMISGEFITYGDFYYEDDEDATIVKFTVYKDMQRAAKREEFDYSLLEKAQSEKEYRELMKRAQREHLTATILDRKIAEKGLVFDTGLGNREE